MSVTSRPLFFNEIASLYLELTRKMEFYLLKIHLCHL